MGAQDDAFTPGTHMATSLHDLERVGVIDVGSNSVRLVVFDGVARAPAYFYNEKVLAGLGRGVRETGVLHPDGRARALAALRRFMTLAAQMDLKSVTAVATAAVREAEDGADFVSEVARETGLALRIITGEEEAILAAQGVLLGRPAARGLVCDIGGPSMELARISNGEVKDGITTPLAPLTLGDMSESARAEAVRATMEQIASRFPKRGRTLYLVGGSWRAIGRLDMVLRGYPLRVLQSYTMAADDCLNTAEWATDRTASELKEITPETSSARLGLVPLAANVLVSLVETLEPSDVVISSYGLREGLLYAQMTPELRALDPLLEAAGHMEASSARRNLARTARPDWPA